MQSQQRRPERDEALSLPQRTRQSATLTIAFLLILSACALPSSASALSAADFRAAAENASIRATAAVDHAADAVSDFLRALISRFTPLRAASAAHEKSAPITTLPPVAQPATTTIIYQTITQPVIERVVEHGTVLGASTDAEAVTRDELDAALNAVRSQFGLLSASIGANTFVSTPTFAHSQRIDQLANITLNGVSGLTDADVPDGITASNYLLLTGGTLSGDFAVTGDFSVAGAQTLSGAITIPYLVATSSTSSSFAGSVGVGTTTPWALLSVNPNGISGPAFAIGSSTATSFVVTNAGFVGIGTTTPLYRFDVRGNLVGFNVDTPLHVTSDANYTGVFIDATKSGGAGQSNVFFGKNGAKSFQLGSDLSGDGTKDFFLWDSSNSAVRFYVSAAGNVGIGQTSPTYKLDVTGNGHFTSLVDAASFVATSSSATSTFAGGLAVEASGLVYDFSTNRVGIGTASPSTALEVAGAEVRVNTTNPLLRAYNGSTELGYAQWYSPDSSLYLWNSQNGPMYFGTNNTEQARISAGGLFGIGSTTPWAKLSVTNTGSGPSFLVEDSTSPDSTPFIIDASGLVGIGTTNPAQPLTIKSGGPSIGLYHSVESGNYRNWGILSQSADYGLEFKVSNAAGGDPVAGTTRMFITNAGNLGIGTTSPGALLAVHGAGLISSGLTVGGTLTATSSVNLATVSGNVGIGTTNPDNGKVEVKGGTVCVDTDSDDNASSCIASESDERLKENIQTLDASASLDTLLNLNPVSFDWRATDPEVLKHYPLIARFASSTHSVGLIAQEVQRLFPLAIEQETVGDAEVQYFQLDYTKFVPLIISGAKELARRLDELVNTVASFAQRFTSDQIVARNQLCVGDTCISEAQLRELLEKANMTVAANGAAQDSPDAANSLSTPPVIQINGENPAYIHVGDSYADLGAIIIAPEADKNLGIKTFLNGTLVSDIAVDTSEPATDTIDYVVTSPSGLTSTSTRTVIIEALESASSIPEFDDAPQLAPDYDATTTLSALPASDASVSPTAADATSTAQ